MSMLLLACIQDSDLTLAESPKNNNVFRDSLFAQISLSIDSLFSEAFKQGDFAGAGVSVVIDSFVVFERGVGYRDSESNFLVDRNTIFRIGSVSKSFTGVLSAILEQKELIDYNGEVRSQIPSFKLSDSLFDEQLKLGHLLSHTSGFPYHSYTNLVEDGLSMGEIIPYFKGIKKLQEPGSQYSYQNAAYGAVGLYLTNTLGSTIQDLFYQEMYKPLEMNSSTTSYKSLVTSGNKAVPHARGGDGGWNKKSVNQKYYNAVTAGGINSSAADMSRFLLLLLENQPEVLTSESIERMIKARIRTKVGYRYYKQWEGFYDSYYGYGWRIHTFADSAGVVNDTLYHHGGLVNDYRSEIAFHRREKFGISVLFNCNTPRSRTIIPEIIAIIRRHKKRTSNL